MKYFTYTLKAVGVGEAAGPDVLLPEDSKLGYQMSGNPYIYYGAADINDLTFLKEYEALEITKAEFDTVYSSSILPFPPV